MPTYEEWQEEHIKAQQKVMDENAKTLEKSQKDAIEGGPSGAETPEEQEERVAAVRSVMIFGDTDTTAGAGAVGTDVPSADNEAAGVAAAEADSKGLDASSDEARRQVDVDAGTTASAEEVTENAPDENADVQKVEVVDDKKDAPKTARSGRNADKK